MLKNQTKVITIGQWEFTVKLSKLIKARENADD